MEKEITPDSLIYVNDTMPGYGRSGNKGNFYYTDNDGNRLSDKKILKRIQELVIPPDWKNVWICRIPQGHIQVTGRDSKGRKQYIYHALWLEKLSQIKYDSLKDFGENLPKIRKQVNKDLRTKNWNKKKVTALAVKVMDELYLRVGNKLYQKKNGTIGLTTLRKKHLIEDGNHFLLKFKSKSGKLRTIKISHPSLKKQLKQCSELPGYEIFRYQSEGKFVPLNSSDINNYLREISKSDITSKDFRTWAGTVLTVKLNETAKEICENNSRKNHEPTLVQLVAKELNNAVAVCRKYYIHPKVLEFVTNGKISKYQSISRKMKCYSKEESIVMNILKESKET